MFIMQHFNDLATRWWQVTIFYEWIIELFIQIIHLKTLIHWIIRSTDSFRNTITLLVIDCSLFFRNYFNWNDKCNNMMSVWIEF